MIRFLALLLLASPACAATLPAIQIEECRAVESSPHQSMVPGRIAPNAAQTCEWPGPVDLPPLDIAGLDPLALKTFELAVPGASPRTKAGPAVWMQSGRPIGGGGVSRVGSPSSSSFAAAYARADARCGCVGEPETPDPAPIPLPAPAWLLCVALWLLWRTKR